MGLEQLLKVIPAGHTVVCEATGGYERTLIRFLHQKKRIMLEVKGVGEVTAWTILANLSEISQTDRSRIAALVAVAPYKEDSGKTFKKRCIQAGRAKIRRTLYMATRTAAIHNPHIKAYVDRLQFEKGKPYKCAIVAAMRKLLIHTQVRLKKIMKMYSQRDTVANSNQTKYSKLNRSGNASGYA